MNKLLTLGSISLLSLIISHQASAHIGYGDLGTLSNVGDTSSLTKTSFKRFGWVAGTDNDLGDSHVVGNAGGYFKFSVAQSTAVNINVTAANSTMNPAFSVYAGQLPVSSHDYDNNDPNLTYDENFLLYQASAHDKRPDDPLISHYIPVGFDSNGVPLTDPAAGYALLVENPIWNTPDPNGINLGGLTPAQWYEANYKPHDGYRDTLNFTTLGGLKLEADVGWVPANFDSLDGPFQGFTGQFDPFGDWSMSNSNGEWTKVDYISSVSNALCDGPNCLTTDAGGFLNPGHFAGNNGLSESMVLMLAAGDYMIAIDGEACNNATIACTSPFEAASITITAVNAVPLPSALWLFGSALVGLISVKRRQKLVAV